MFWNWWKRRRRQGVFVQPFPDAWREILQANVRHCQQLSPDEIVKLQGLTHVLVADKNWEGCGGLNMTDEIRVTIAAQIALLVLGFEPPQYFDHVQSILVYPDVYVAPGHTVTRGGVVMEGDSAREGEAWYRGPVVLSWSDALAGGRRRANGGNVVLHEFAHQLDMLNGRVTDGVPPLEDPRQADRWIRVTGEHYKRLARDCRHGRPPVLDCYGTTNPTEFFAVATEAFFERSDALLRHHPELYEILRDYYQQDPASWKSNDVRRV
jgi:Mlc titration factor MtfA (ptsG expression regulator)